MGMLSWKEEMTDARLPAIPKGTGVEKCGTKNKAAQRGVERLCVTTAGIGESSDPRNSGPEASRLFGAEQERSAGLGPCGGYSLLEVRKSMCD